MTNFRNKARVSMKLDYCGCKLMNSVQHKPRAIKSIQYYKFLPKFLNLNMMYQSKAQGTTQRKFDPLKQFT